MSSLTRWWRAVGGGGELHRWTQRGEALEGIWRGLSDEPHGPVGTLGTPQGLVRFAVTTALLHRLDGIPEWSELRIEYLGIRRSKAGRESRDFAVWVAEADPLADAAPGGEGR